MKIVGSRNSMLTMREAFYGTRRFEEFSQRVGTSPATTASNLKSLTAAGLLERQPYKDEGARTRSEYVLSEAGRALMPALLALFEWGSRYGSAGSAVEMVHADCGEPVELAVSCRAGHRLTTDDVELRLRG